MTIIHGSVKLAAGASLFAAFMMNASFAETKKVAIASLGPHPALNAVVAGFKKGVKDEGVKKGDSVSFTYKDANFDPSIVAQMLTALEATGPDVILTVTTPITQASKRIIRNKKIPIVFAPVTDPVDAGLVKSWKAGSARFTGASNLQSMPTVFEFAKKLLGNVKTAGLLYNPGDANDVVNIKYAREAAKKMGIAIKAVSVETSNDIPVRVNALKGADFLYLIPSSMLQPAMPAVAAAARRNKIPVINASPNGVSKGLILASMSVSWFEVGRQAGIRAAKILKGAKPSELSIFRPAPANHKAIISAKRLKATGRKLPDVLKNCNCVK